MADIGQDHEQFFVPEEEPLRLPQPERKEERREVEVPAGR